MTEERRELSELRKMIDDVDEQLHDLVMRRGEIAAGIAEVKKAATDGGASMIRPEREAEILRRLMKRHSGPFPEVAVANLWRELIAACVLVQEPFRVEVFGGGDPLPHWDLARGHCGSTVHMTLQDSANHVITSVRADRSVLGVLPTPEADEREPWWPSLLTDVPGAPRIVGRLPFIETGDVDEDQPSAYIIGRLDRAESGQDVTLVAIPTNDDVSRGRITKWAGEAGLEAHVLANHGPDRNRRFWVHLVAVTRHLRDDDARLVRLAEVSNGKAHDASVIGGYPTPLRLDSDGSRRAPSRRRRGL